MNARTRGTQLRRIHKTMATYDATPERMPWLITLDGEQITILAPLQCAIDLEEQGYKIVAAPTEQVTAAELHRRSIHFYGHAIRHGGKNETWTRIEAVHLSRHQGIDIDLLGGGTLQACFPEDVTYWVTVERI